MYNMPILCCRGMKEGYPDMRMFTERTIGKILESKARKNGVKPLIYFRDKVASYEQVNKRANRVANWFLSAGFKKGDKVAILLNNCLEWLYVWLGLAEISSLPVIYSIL